MSIKSKSLFVLVLIPAVLIIGFAVTLFQVTTAQELEDSRARIGVAARSIAQEVRTALVSGFEMIRGVAAAPVTIQMAEAMRNAPEGLDNDDYEGIPGFDEYVAYLDAVAANTTADVLYLASAGSPGVLLNRDVQISPGFDVRARDYYRLAFASPTEPVISTPRVSAEQSEVPIIAVTAAHAVVDTGGDPIGLVAFNYRFNRVVDLLEMLAEEHGVGVALYDTLNQEVIWSGLTSEAPYFYDVDSPLDLETLAASLTGEDSASDQLVARLNLDDDAGFDARRAGHLLHAAPVDGTRWSVLVSFPRAVAMRASRASKLPIVLGFVGVFAAVQLAMLLLALRSIVRPIGLVRGSLVDLAEAGADLTVTVERTTRDELGEVAEAFNRFVARLHDLMVRLKGVIARTADEKQRIAVAAEESSASVEQISATIGSIEREMGNLDDQVQSSSEATKEIARSITALSEQVDIQAAAVASTVQTVQEMRAGLEEVSDVVLTRQRLASRLNEATVAGRQQVEETSSTIQSVASRITAIESMASTIATIAAQTNLLSMNAAIEAAHAGERGKGFAVVAGEIRALAESAGRSSQEIRAEVQEITGAVRRTEEHSASMVEAFRRVAEETSQTIDAFTDIKTSLEGLKAGAARVEQAAQKTDHATSTVRERALEIGEKTTILTATAERVGQVSRFVNGAMSEAGTGTREIVEAMQLLRESTFTLSQVVTDLDVVCGEFVTSDDQSIELESA